LVRQDDGAMRDVLDKKAASIRKDASA